MKKANKKILPIFAGVAVAGVAVYGAFKIAQQIRKNKLMSLMGGAKNYGPLVPVQPGPSFPAGTVPQVQPGGNSKPNKFPGVPSDSILKSPAELQKVFQGITDIFGFGIAANVERIYRLETANFTSTQYLNTGSAGMVAAKQNYPYGWNSLAPFWERFQNFAPLGVVFYPSKGLNYIAFPGAGGFMALATVLKDRGNNAGSWYSTEPKEQAEYLSYLKNIPLQYA